MNYLKYSCNIPEFVNNDLLQYCDDISKFSQHTAGGIDFSYYLLIGNQTLDDSVSIQWCRHNIPFQFSRYCIFYLPANKGTGIHVDGNVNNDRITVLSIPILPLTNYASTLFFHEDGEVVDIANYDTREPIFLNTQVLHSVYTREDRFALQLFFSEPITYFADKI